MYQSGFYSLDVVVLLACSLDCDALRHSFCSYVRGGSILYFNEGKNFVGNDSKILLEN